MNKLEEIRKDKRMTVSELSRKSGISRQTIKRLETEELECANAKTLKALADALEVKIYEFFSE